MWLYMRVSSDKKVIITQQSINLEPLPPKVELLSFRWMANDQGQSDSGASVHTQHFLSQIVKLLRKISLGNWNRPFPTCCLLLLTDETLGLIQLPFLRRFFFWMFLKMICIHQFFKCYLKKKNKKENFKKLNGPIFLYATAWNCEIFYTVWFRTAQSQVIALLTAA